MGKRIFIFTQFFPYGIGEKWKLDEISIISEYVDKVVIIPFQSSTQDPQLTLPSNVEVRRPLLPVKIHFKNLIRSFNWNSQVLKVFLKDFFFRKVFKKIVWIKSWFLNLLIIDYLIGKQRLLPIIQELEQQDILYFYWGTGPGLLCPFFKGANGKKLVKFHGGDLYEYRSGGYLPLRVAILNSVDYALFISQNGKEYLESKFAEIAFKTKLTRLGVYSSGSSFFSKDETLRIVSCSFLVPVKRINLIIDALNLLKVPIEWTHIGDGPLWQDLKASISKLPANIRVSFTGFIPSEKILSFFEGKPFDLFLNVSESEGVPVSIMEAISAGIPVYATNVGGTKELVSSNIGKLLPAALTPELLAEELRHYYHLPLQTKEKFKKNTLQVFEQKCNAEILYHEFGRFINSL